MSDQTADQIAWVEIAQAVRVQLCKYAENIPAMNPDEVKTYVETVRTALLNEQNAASFDKDLELMLARNSYFG